MLALIGGCQSLQGSLSGEEADDLGEVTLPPDAPLRYDVRYDVQPDVDLKRDIEAVSILIARQQRALASIAALERRVRDDVEQVHQVLRSRGYYDGAVTPSVDAKVEPAQVVIDVRPGRVFLLNRYDIRYTDPAPAGGGAPLRASDAGVTLGQPASAEILIEAERRIVRRLQENGYPDARILDERYIADRADATLGAEITVAAGPPARFGDLEVQGLDRVDRAYLHRIIQWTPDRPYDIRQVERVRAALVATGLFESVTVRRRDTTTEGDAETPPAGVPDIVPVAFDVVERPPRSISFGVTYSTDDEGFGGEVTWEHRNLFGHAERLSATARGSQVRQAINSQFRKPNVGRPNQSIVAKTDFTREASDAFDGLIAGAFVGIERPFLRHWTITAGPAGEISRIKQAGDTDRFVLLGLNNTAVYDRRNDKTDPTQGIIATTTLSPYASVSATNTRFLVTDASIAGFLPVFGKDRVVLAGRGRLGSVVSADRFDIPANQRLYAGGGGSVRGYAFRSIGPLDDSNDPLGGRSVIEVNAETRIRLSERIGIAPFVDGGEVYSAMTPDLNEDLRWGAGIGLQYNSPVGPFRVDVAFPLNGREADDSFQLYFFAGQAF
jgi:translocation and assembly module TamA